MYKIGSNSDLDTPNQIDCKEISQKIVDLYGITCFDDYDDKIKELIKNSKKLDFCLHSLNINVTEFIHCAIHTASKNIFNKRLIKHIRQTYKLDDTYYQ